MRYLKISFILLFLCAIPVFISCGVYAEENDFKSEIYLDQGGDTPVEVFTRRVLERVYMELGIRVRYLKTPLARSYVEANSGRLDGLRGRVGTVTNDYESLIKVDVSLVTFNVILIVNKETCQIASLPVSKDCDITQLNRVGTVRGFKALEDYRESNPLPFNVVELTSKEQALKMLSTEKLQAVILSESLVAEQLLTQNLNWSSYVLSSSNLYHYLNSKHQGLAIDVTRVLAKLEGRGWLEEQRHYFHLNSKPNEESFH